ncbi:MAG: DUF2799 domain-containing protein [Rhodobacteraceae bacterium]|nr:DUF2799 domain-containing protein [Paracoccaceae bacterium]
MRFLFVLMILPFLAACASLTEQQCQVGDWANIGYNDGVNGRSSDYVSRHFDACADQGISPDTQAWQTGRTQGLLRYCTVDNAYIIGRNGRSFNTVCPINQRASLGRAFDWGAEYYLLSEEIDSYEDEIDALENLIRTSYGHPDLTPEERLQRQRLRSQIRLAEIRIRRLELRQRRYDSAPF